MKRNQSTLARAYAILALLFATPALAQTLPVYRAIIGSIGPVGTADTTTLRGGTWSDPQYAHVTVTCYYAQSADAICAGGGDFDRVQYVQGVSPCGSTGLDNRGTLIQDAGHNCFYRKNFGLNGVVDARQCGVYGDGKEHTPSDGELLLDCMALASNTVAPLAPNSIAVVNTGGGVILDNDTALSVPANVHLTCGATNPSGGNNNDFRIFKGNDPTNGLNISNAIVIYPGLIPPGVTTTAPIQVLDRSSAISGCLIVASAGTPDANGVYPNPYAPSRWYPGCDPNFLDCSDDHDTNNTQIRSAILEYSAFNPNPSVAYPSGGPASHSIAIAVGDPLTEKGGSGTTIRDIAVVGFGTCLLGTAPGLAVENVSSDCDTGINLSNLDTPHLNKVSVGPALTGGDIAYLAIEAPATFPQFVSDGSGQYQLTIDFDAGVYPDYKVRNGDTVWVVPQPKDGAESAAGRWTVQCSDSGGGCPSPAVGCPGPLTCQTFSLQDSICSIGPACTNPITLAGTAMQPGYPPAALTNVGFFDSLGAPVRGASFVSVGQTVSDTGGSGGTPCLQPGTTVTAVWPAKGIVYVSKPPLCVSQIDGDTFTFHDNTYTGSPDCGSNDMAPKGCVIVNTSFRFGPGIYAKNAGGFRIYDCTTFEHEVSFYMDTGSRGDFVSCATGNNVGLPDRNLAALNAASTDPNLNGNIVSLLITGDHMKGADGTTKDACDIRMTNATLGQHRNNGIVVLTACTGGNKFTGVGLGVDNHGGNSVALEVDAGSVQIDNSDGGTAANILKAEKMTFGSGEDSFDAPASLRISNNEFSPNPLYIENAKAAASISGCGNVFSVPTPYLCAPSSFTQPPGGRLTLTQSQPVMQSDVTGSTVYYVPYISQQVPIYTAPAGVFGLSDISPSGLVLNLDSTSHVPNALYDVFAELDAAALELCSGPAWSNSGAGSSARASDVTQVNGVWVNKTAMSCHFNHNMVSGSHSCAPQECTYLGTFLTTSAGGQIAQQFGPVSGSGGGAPCLCLYNGYNRVIVTSKSLDTSGPYMFAGGSTSFSWEYMNNNSKNSIRVVDGLGQMQISSQLTDVMFSTASTKTAAIGVDLNPPAVSVPAPTPIVQTKSAASASYGHTLTNPPILGLWSAQAVDGALGTGGTANFGGNGLQQLSVQVAD